MSKYETATEVAKRIRKALKGSFPGVKFSVRSSVSSLSDAIRVRWTDGPTVEPVEAIATQHQHVRRCEVTGDILGGGNRFVFCDRDISPQLKARALEQIRRSSGIADFNPDGVNPEHWRLYWRTVSEMEGEMPGKPTKPTKSATPTPHPFVEAPATFAVTGAWTWLTFPVEPAQAILDALHTDGWRWSKKRHAWYHLEGRTPPASVSYEGKTA